MRGSIARLFGVLLLVGCNEVGSADTARLNLRIVGNAEAFVPESSVPLEGARICELDTDNCALTDERGRATIELPFEEETAFTIEKEGYDPTLVAEIVPAGGTDQFWGMPLVEELALQYECLMSPYPRIGTGEIYIVVQGAVTSGATFDLPGATGKLWYEDPDASDFCERWGDNDLTATAAVGRGGFVEVPAGTFRVDIGGTVEECSRSPSGWRREDGIWVPVREGYVTFVAVRCQ
jgi:hypothetical protein